MYYFKKEQVTVPSDLSLIKMDQDPFYRYKMEELRVSYEKKYTILTNVCNVASNLRIRPEYILEHFALALNAKYEQMVFKKRTQFRMKGFFEHQKLQRLLDMFIIEHLLCKNCLLPEVKYRSDINRLKADCRACGYFEIFDPRQDKMKEIIYNNPLTRGKQEIEKQKEEDLLYGNRQLQYESVSSDNDDSKDSQQSEKIEQEASNAVIN